MEDKPLKYFLYRRIHLLLISIKAERIAGTSSIFNTPVSKKVTFNKRASARLISKIIFWSPALPIFVAKRDDTEQLIWGLRKSVLVLLLSIGLAALESHILVDALQPLIDAAHLHETFVGLVIIAIITNVPEHLAAIGYGRRDNITLSLEIGTNSAIQIALFVAPILVFISPLLAAEMSLAFAPFQMVAMILTVMIINYIGADGICNWLEGVQLVAVYIIIAIAFYFI